MFEILYAGVYFSNFECIDLSTSKFYEKRFKLSKQSLTYFSTRVYSQSGRKLKVCRSNFEETFSPLYIFIKSKRMPMCIYIRELIFCSWHFVLKEASSKNFTFEKRLSCRCRQGCWRVYHIYIHTRRWWEYVGWSLLSI